MIRRKLGLSLLIFTGFSLVGITILDLNPSRVIPPPEPPISHVGLRSGLTFSPSANLIYYYEDNERCIGFRSWIIEDPLFNLSSQSEIIMQSEINISEGEYRDILVEFFEEHTGKGKIVDPVRSFSISFTHAGDFHLDCLETKHTKYIYLNKNSSGSC